MFVCCRQDGRLCCSFDFRCGDVGRAVGYDGVVGGTGLPELQDPVLQRLPTVAESLPDQNVDGSKPSSPISNGNETDGRTSTSTAATAIRLLPSTVEPSGVGVQTVDNKKQYSEAVQVDNSSVVGNPVSTKKVIFVSDSENHDINNNKTEIENVNGKSSSTMGVSPGPG